MAGFVKLLMIAFTAAMVENAIFSRALVTRKMLFLKNREEILTFSAVITLMTVISGVICYAADSLLLYPRGVSIYIRSALYVLIMAAVHTAMIVAASRKVGEWYARAKNVLLMAGYNVAVLGTVLLCSFNRYNLWERLFYFVGTGVGVTLALVLLDVANQNIAMSRVPRIFRGLPILLLYIGILSLAFYGLIGHPITF